jgi:hypothetical protein
MAATCGYDYGFLPPRFFNQVLNVILIVVWHRLAKRRIASRD